MALFSLLAGVIGGAFATFAATATGLAISAFIDKVIVSVAVSLLSKALNPTAKAQKQPIGVSGSLQSGEAVPRQFPIGSGMTAGSLVYANEWGTAGGTPNAYFTQVFALSDLPVKGLQTVMVNGVYVTLDTVLTTKGYAVLDYRSDGVDYLWIKFYDGTQTVADSFLTGTVATAARPWPATRVGVGVAYAICTSRHNQELFTGFPTFKFVLDAVRLYDPAKDTTAGGSGTQLWATPSTWGGDGDYLPAVQAYNILRGISYGGAWVTGFQGMTAGRLPNADWVAASNACRATVTGASGPEPTYRAGGMLSVDATCGDMLDQIMAACAGRIGETGGIYKPMVGGVGSTVASFTDDDIITTEEQSLTMFPSLADTVNSITAQFPEPAEGFATSFAPPLINAAYEAADGGRRLPASLTLMNVPYAEQVQRLMKIALGEARRSIRHTNTLPPAFWALEPNDTVAWTSARHGYAAKLFRIDAVLDRIDSHVTADMTELDPADYNFTTGTDYRAQGTRAPVASAPAAQAVPSFAAAGYTINGGASNQAPAIQLTWDAAQIEDATAIRWQGRIPLIGTAVVFTGQMVNPEDGAAFVSEGILPGTAYEVRAKPVLKRKTAWTAWVSATTPAVSPPVAAGSISNAKLAVMAPATFKMRAAAAGTGSPIDGTAAQAKTALAIAAADVSGLGALALLAQVDTAQIANLAVVTGKLAANAVLNGKLAQMATLTLKGNNSGVLADPLDLTAAQVKTLLAIGSGDVSGLGALALLAQVDTAQIANLAVVTGKLAANAVLNGKLAQMATLTLKGNNSGVLADPLDLTAAQVKTLLAITGADHADGMGVMLVPNTADVIACCLNGGATASTLAGAVDRMDIYQFFCGRGVTVSGMKTSISTGVAAATVKLQLYDTNTNGRPTTLLGETGAISAAIAGIAGAVFAGGNVVLTAGKTYFVGIRHSSTASHDCWSANSVPHLNAGVASIAARAVFRRAGMTFALGATNPWGYAASEINTANPAALWLTVA